MVNLPSAPKSFHVVAICTGIACLAATSPDVASTRNIWAEAAATLAAIEEGDPALKELIDSTRDSPFDNIHAADSLEAGAKKLAPVSKAIRRGIELGTCAPDAKSGAIVEAVVANAMLWHNLRPVLLLEAAAAYQGKQPLLAIDALSSMARFGSLAAGCGGGLIEYVVGIGIYGTALEHLHWLLRHRTVPNHFLESLGAQLGRLLLHPDLLTRALVGEMTFFTANLPNIPPEANGEDVGRAFGLWMHNASESGLKAAGFDEAPPANAKLAKTIETARGKTTAVSDTLSSVLSGHPSAFDRGATLRLVEGFRSRLSARADDPLQGINDPLILEFKQFAEQALAATTPLQQMIDAQKPPGFLARWKARWDLRKVPNPLGQMLVAKSMKLLVDPIGTAHTDQMQAQTLLNVVEAIVALHIRYDREGQWPDTVALLPRDASSGEPLRYETNPPRFRSDQRDYGVVEAITPTVDAPAAKSHPDCPRVRHSGQDMDTWLGPGFSAAVVSMRLVPEADAMEMIGFRVVSVKEGGLGPAICLETGDTVVQVNDIRLTSPELGFAIFESFLDHTTVRLTLLRQGVKQVITIDIDR